jgi:hypothetical protein
MQYNSVQHNIVHIKLGTILCTFTYKEQLASKTNAKQFPAQQSPCLIKTLSCNAMTQ